MDDQMDISKQDKGSDNVSSSGSLSDYELSKEDEEYKLHTDIFNVFQTWYKREFQPSYPALIEETNDDTYTNGAMETLYEFMEDFNDNISNLSMTRTYDLERFLESKQHLNYDEYYVLKIVNDKGHLEKYASPLALSLFIFMSNRDWKQPNWDIDVVSG